ncbi:MAG TPA: hypothetical protein VFL99_06895 [Segeticoccus sp.]|uniref:hypothetical protein n=1 Tax=Segeticoccus sp. TaxID=2706531 RepID=UPI002D80D2C7|nr:hypothetical protein [Segeticoccus sp.]HET8600036.1 hypothetical protein [Segeticoccus sp.]
MSQQDQGQPTGSGAASDASGSEQQQGSGYRQTDDSGTVTGGADSMGDLGSHSAGEQSTGGAGGGGHAPESVTDSGKGSVDGAPNTTSSTSGVAEGITGPEWVREHGTPGAGDQK